LVLIGVAGALVLSATAAIGLAVLCLLLIGTVLLAGQRARKIAAAEALRNRLSAWKDQWAVGALASPAPSSSSASLSGSSPGMGVGEVSTLEGFVQAMEVCARERDDLEAREADSTRRWDGLRETLERIDTAIKAIQEEEEIARRAERDWLARQGVADFETYLSQAARCKQVGSDLAKRRTELEILAGESGLEAFRRDLRRKLQDLDQEGVAEKGRDEAALRRMRLRRQELQNTYEVLGRKEGDLIAQKERLAGEISGAMGKLAPEIVAWEDRLAEAEAEIRAKELDKRAASLVRDIFREIGDGADLMLKGLAGEMERMLGNILPKGRAVTLSGLEDRHIQVEDAAGGSRSLDQLSTGTRHAMVLAAKLAMALKHRQGPGILVLDEPFLAMDDERETRALELLRDFHDRNGWQIILLTKEIHLRDKVLGLFTDARVLELSRAVG
ncbi:MAG: hypothetical protein JWP91_2315, partial [Fibrobacteres bacterium]|nr:hypothetical protein [Fibrobacterota bacterium]